MSTNTTSIVSEPPQAKDLQKPRYFMYLPREGLQGENIPSHILWENIKIKTAQISFRPPLKPKEVFNAASWEVKDNLVIVHAVELDGYVGMSFESSKVDCLDVMVPVKYVLSLANGEVIKETREIRLFKPKLEIKIPTTKIAIDPKTGFIKGRVGIKNVGRGVLIMRISSTEDSSLKLETPLEHREFAEKFVVDLQQEMSKLAEDFPIFKPFWEQMFVWETKEFVELTAKERIEFIKYINDLAKVLASDKNLLRGFMEGYSKAFAKNTELIEIVRKVISVYESLVSKDMLLINPFDEVTIPEKTGEIHLAIEQTDRVLDTYDDIKLPKIELYGSQGFRIPVYRLFEWG